MRILRHTSKRGSHTSHRQARTGSTSQKRKRSARSTSKRARGGRKLSSRSGHGHSHSHGHGHGHRHGSIASREEGFLENGSYSTSASASHSSRSVSTERSTKQTRPSHKQRQKAAAELRELGFTHLKELAKGAFGYVYEAKYGNHVVALKMVLTARHKGLVKKSETIRNLFREAATVGSGVQRPDDGIIHTPESQYYVEDLVFGLKRKPDITCHVMEFVPGKDMLEYMQAFEHHLHRRRASSPNANAKHRVFKHVKSTKPDAPAPPTELTYDTFFEKLCSMVRAVRFLSRARVVFNDLKLENVVCMDSGVVLVDYIDSNYGCSKLKCKEGEERIISTYNDTINDRASLSEDVWRLALIILDSMMQLQSKHFVDGYPSEQITRAMADHPHEYPTQLVHELVDTCVNTTWQIFDTDADIPVEQLKSTLNAMLHEKPEERPSADELLDAGGVYVFARKGTSPALTPERLTAKRDIAAVRKAISV